MPSLVSHLRSVHPQVCHPSTIVNAHDTNSGIHCVSTDNSTRPGYQAPASQGPQPRQPACRLAPTDAEVPESPPLWPSDEDNSDKRDNAWDGSEEEQPSQPDNEGC
jgi:hypothetical protein